MCPRDKAGCGKDATCLCDSSRAMTPLLASALESHYIRVVAGVE